MRTVWVSFDTIGRDCLEAAAEAGAEVVGVVTLPGPIDPNRSGQCSFDEVASRLDAALHETHDVNSEETLDFVCGCRPDAIFVVGWSQIVHDDFIGLVHAKDGVFGMHPTLLPRHRGRAPIPWAILSGLARTGVTLFEILDATPDSGLIVGQRVVDIAPDETATTLFEKLSIAHVDLVREYVPRLPAVPRVLQEETRASAWPKRTPADGIIDWETRASYLYDWVRAQTRPYPGAFTWFGLDKIIVWRARAVDLHIEAPAGLIVSDGPEGIVVACGEGGLVLEDVQTDVTLGVGMQLG